MPTGHAEILQERQNHQERDSGKGVTDSDRATLSDGRVTHDAQIQTVNIAMTVFQAGIKPS